MDSFGLVYFGVRNSRSQPQADTGGTTDLSISPVPHIFRPEAATRGFK